jgi:hypothetical protein
VGKRTDMSAYLVMMCDRLIELYLKIMMDTILAHKILEMRLFGNGKVLIVILVDMVLFMILSFFT